MKIKTSIILPTTPSRAWEFLFSHVVCPKASSAFDSFCFNLGVPHAHQCSTIGDKRYCFMEGGEIQQIITERRQPSYLAIKVIAMGGKLEFYQFVESMSDEFSIEPAGDGLTKVTRTSDLRLKWYCLPLWPSFYSGLKIIHGHVFSSWELTIEVEKEVIPMLLKGKNISAIEHVKRRTGLGLMASKKLVETQAARYFSSCAIQN